jgi:hypothetical protein
MIFSIGEIWNLEKPQDIDRIGTLTVVNEQYEWNPQENKFYGNSNELKFHVCTVDDIKKFG